MDFVNPRSTPFIPPKYRNQLPHLYKPGGTYFVTWRLADAILPSTHRASPRPLTSTTVDPAVLIAQFDPPLQLGSCLLRDQTAAQILQDSITKDHGVRCNLLAWCIMPNHVHVVFAPYTTIHPSRLLQSWKGGSSRLINQSLSRTGPLWERESFDHLVRSIPHLEQFIHYTEANPVVAGLCDKPEAWPWSSARCHDDRLPCS